MKLTYFRNKMQWTGYFLVFFFVFSLLPIQNLSAKMNDLAGHWAEETVNEWIAKGLVKGYPDGTFKPDKNVSRAEFMAMVNGAFNFTAEDTVSYSDVARDAWYYPVVSKAAAAGYISGYEDGTLRPDNPISRAEAAAIVMRVKGLASSVDKAAEFKDAALIPAWSKGAVGAVVAAGIMKGYPDGTFKAEKNITRAEAVVALSKAYKPAIDESKDIIYAEPGIYGPENGTETVKNCVIIKSSKVTLRNTVIEGDLTIDKAVGEGEVYLKNVTVKGTAYIYGGGTNSIHIIDSRLSKAVVEKPSGMVRIVAQGKSEIGQVLAASNVKLQAADLTGKGFSELVVDKRAEVQIVEAKIEKVEIKAEANVKVDAKSEIKDLVVKAEGTIISAEKGAVINTLVADAKVEVKGQAVIESAKINANGVVLETKPQNQEVAPGISAPTVNTPGTTTGGGGGGGGGISPDSSTYYNVTVKVFPSQVAVAVSVDKTRAKKGETVTVNISGIPDGMVFEQIQAIKGGNISFSEIEKGKKYSFIMPDADVELQVILVSKEQAALNSLKVDTEMSVEVADTQITATISYPKQIDEILSDYLTDAIIVSTAPVPAGTQIGIKYNGAEVTTAAIGGQDGVIVKERTNNEGQKEYYVFLSELIGNTERPSITAHAGRTDEWTITVELPKGKYLEADLQILSVISKDSFKNWEVIAQASLQQLILDERYHTYKFEISDLPEDGYFITHDLLNNPGDDSFAGMKPVKVKLAVDEERKHAYDGKVRIEVAAPDNLQLWAEDTNDAWWDITEAGWGPGEGFEIDLDAETEVYVVAKDEGRYEFTLQLIDVSKEYGAEDDIIAEGSFILEAYDEDTDAAINMAKNMQPMTLSIADNTVTATIYYPDEISSLLDNWLTDAIIVSTAPVPEGTQIGIKYNGAEVTTAAIGQEQGQVQVHEWSYDNGEKLYYVFLSELIGDAGTTRPPITAHAGRTDTWQVTFSLPEDATFASGTGIIFDSIISKDDFQNWIILVRGEIIFN